MQHAIQEVYIQQLAEAQQARDEAEALRGDFDDGNQGFHSYNPYDGAAVLGVAVWGSERLRGLVALKNFAGLTEGRELGATECRAESAATAKSTAAKAAARATNIGERGGCVGGTAEAQSGFGDSIDGCRRSGGRCAEGAEGGLGAGLCTKDIGTGRSADCAKGRCGASELSKARGSKGGGAGGCELLLLVLGLLTRSLKNMLADSRVEMTAKVPRNVL